MLNEKRVLTLPLSPTPQDLKFLGIMFECTRILYNSLVSETYKRRNLFRNSNNFKTGVEKLKSGKDCKELFDKARIESGYYLRSAKKYGKDNSLIQWTLLQRKNCWLEKYIDSHMCLKLTERVFIAFEKLDNKQAKKVNFKKKNKDFVYSVEGMNIKSPLRFDANTKELIWKNKLKIPLHKQYLKDEIATKFFKENKTIKFTRIKRTKISGNWKYSIQLIFEGSAIKKDKHQLGIGEVGFDIGTKDISIISKNYIEIDTKLCQEIEFLEKRKRKLLRKINKQRRANNPDNYDDKGRCKKGAKKWTTSNRQQIVEIQYQEICRKEAETRRCLHGNYINTMRSLGDKVKFEDVSTKSWQMSKYGKSIGKYAPGMFIELVKQKFGIDNCFEFPTKNTKFSQLCVCGNYHNKGLNRTHKCEKCGLEVPRNLLSAILAYAVNPDLTVDINKVNAKIVQYNASKKNAQR